MTTLTTRKGDTGTTCIGGGRISKTHPIVEIMGILDLIQGQLGLLYCYPRLKPYLDDLCEDFYQLMGLVHKSSPAYLTEEQVKPYLDRLDKIIAEIKVPKVNKFLRPNNKIAIINNCRATIRRYEHILWKIEEDDKCLSKYFNRLSSVVYAFMLHNEVEKTTNVSMLIIISVCIWLAIEIFMLI